MALVEEIEFRSDGEAVLKGTDVEAHRIAALLAGGMSAEEVRQDYPSPWTRSLPPKRMRRRIRNATAPTRRRR
jgi:hypothetical protein